MNERLIMVVACIATAWLYFAGVFTAGLALHNSLAWQGALAGVGISYFSYLLQGRGVASPALDGATGLCFLISVVLGVGAGICLLV